MDDKYIIHGPQPLSNLTTNSLGEQLYDSLLQTKHLPVAFVDGESDKTVSYKEVLENSIRLAEGLRRYEIRSEDVVGIISENSLEYFYAVLATLFTGSIATMLNPQYTIRELKHGINISKPTIIFCSQVTVKKVIEIKKRMKFIRKVVILDSNQAHSGCETLKEILNSDLNKIENFRIAKVDHKSVAFILYSSGTTGVPKGVMLTHHNFNAALAPVRDHRYTAEKIGTSAVLAFLPFFHSFGLGVVLSSLMNGRKIIIIRSFQPDVFFKCIQKHSVVTLHIVPFMANFLARTTLDKYNMSSVRQIICGAAPLSLETEKALKNRFKGCAIRQVYGTTEAALAMLGYSIEDRRKPGSCGKVLPYVSAKVIDPETGKSLGPDEKGELCFKGSTIMKNYVNNAKASNLAVDDEGWLHTGDIGYYDKEGYFYIVDRIKEFIKYKGFQVPPAELEAVLLTHPKICDAGVVGRADPEAGELPTAFVVIEPNQVLSEKEIQDFVAEQVSPQKRLRGGVRFVSEIPRNPAGKILRRKLKERLIQHNSKL